MALELGREWTYEDYRQLPEDGNRYEIIDGRLYVTPAPSPYHQILSGRLFHSFYPLSQTGKGQMLFAPVDLLMPGATPMPPDLVFLSAVDSTGNRGGSAAGHRDLVPLHRRPGPHSQAEQICK